MRIVLVKWLDPTSATNQWVSDNDVEFTQCQSVGFLIKKERGKIVLAQNISDGVSILISLPYLEAVLYQ